MQIKSKIWKASVYKCQHFYHICLNILVKWYGLIEVGSILQFIPSFFCMNYRKPIMNIIILSVALQQLIDSSQCLFITIHFQKLPLIRIWARLNEIILSNIELFKILKLCFSNFKNNRVKIILNTLNFLG